MPCPHFDIKIVQRSKRQSSVAAAAYQSGEKLFSEYDQKRKAYSDKRGIAFTEIMLPENAPPEYKERNTLWNAVEGKENQWNSQLARRFIMALPKEISREEQIRLMEEYCKSQFVSKGMIADFAIHDKGDGNPHAHILLTLRPMDEQEQWLPKCHKEYDLDENGERIRLPSGRWKSHKVNTVDWNEQKYGEIWRHEWEVVQNKYLENAGRTERVELRSFERQGNPHAPQIHLGAEATAMERRGIQTELGNLNRQVVTANKLFDSIRNVIHSLQSWLSDLSEKIKEQSTMEKPEEQSLAEILNAYMDLRKEGRATWSAYGQNKGQINDLKQMFHLIGVLREQDIDTIPKLGKYLNETNAIAREIRTTMKANDSRIADIDGILEAVKTMKETKAVHDKYVSIGWKSRKEKFADEHSDELARYRKADRTLKKLNVELPIDKKELKSERTTLSNDNVAQLAELEKVNASLEDLKQIRWCIRQVLPEALPTVVNGKKSAQESLQAKQRKLELEKPEKKSPQKKQNMEL